MHLFTSAAKPTSLRGNLINSLVLASVFAISATGCDSEPAASTAAASDATTSQDSADSAAAAAIELVGTWTTNFGSDEKITADKWGPQKIASYDNAANVAYTQNPPDDQYGPNKFSKQVWTEPKANVFYYCTVDYGKDSLDLAKASTLVADDKDLDKKGCAGFGWTKMTKKP